MLDFPIKFTPVLKEKIWGGSKLKDILNKDTEQENLGESWEISGVKGDVSVVDTCILKGASLDKLLEEYKGSLVGENIYDRFGAEFPLLIKFIDAKTELSVQLHPHDQLAKERHDSFGKTEMWYIIQADNNAEINVGFKGNVTKEEYLQALGDGRITDLLNFEKVQKGDAFFINTGKVHAIGAGVLLAEIQQTSDITYRIYDWDRKDSNGVARELHTDLALDAIDFERKEDFRLDYEHKLNTSSNIAKCKYFTTNFLPIEGRVEMDYSHVDSFVIYMCVSGNASIEIGKNSEEIRRGETVLIPAINNQVTITSKETELLEVYIS